MVKSYVNSTAKHLRMNKRQICQRKPRSCVTEQLVPASYNWLHKASNKNSERNSTTNPNEPSTEVIPSLFETLITQRATPFSLLGKSLVGSDQSFTGMPSRSNLPDHGYALLVNLACNEVERWAAGVPKACADALRRELDFSYCSLCFGALWDRTLARKDSVFAM
jgi:hypothetical protein